MKLEPVRSSNLAAIGYDPATKTLEIEFHNGARWHYTGVPASKHEELMHAKSIGSHFSRHIRGTYDAVPAPPKERDK